MSAYKMKEKMPFWKFLRTFFRLLLSYLPIKPYILICVFEMKALHESFIYFPRKNQKSKNITKNNRVEKYVVFFLLYPRIIKGFMIYIFIVSSAVKNKQTSDLKVFL